MVDDQQTAVGEQGRCMFSSKAKITYASRLKTSLLPSVMTQHMEDFTLVLRSCSLYLHFLSCHTAEIQLTALFFSATLLHTLSQTPCSLSRSTTPSSHAALFLKEPHYSSNTRLRPFSSANLLTTVIWSTRMTKTLENCCQMRFHLIIFRQTRVDLAMGSHRPLPMIT